MITNWIGAVRHILVIVAIELRDVEDLLIWTLFQVRENVGNDVVFTFDIFSSGPNSSSIMFQRITRSVLNIL